MLSEKQPREAERGAAALSALDPRGRPALGPPIRRLRSRVCQNRRANGTSFNSAARHVIASGAKQSPMLRVEIASSLCSSQSHTCDLPSDFAFALAKIADPLFHEPIFGYYGCIIGL
jgi:hypothetical protein